jgi:nucleoside-diphosphate-sugar epimerase
MGSSIIGLGMSGFLGPQILSKYPEIISVGRTKPVTAKYHYKCDNLDNLEEVLKQIDFDKVIMMIESSNHHMLNKGGTLAIEKNVLPLKKVFQCMLKFDIKKMVSFSTILLYDKELMQLPVNENTPLNPYQNDYVFSKYLGEELAYYYKEVPNIVVRLTNIYGPTTVLGRPDIVNQLIEGLIFNKKASVFNTEVKRDFIYTPDAADAIISLLDSYFEGVINVGTGQIVSIRDIVTILEKLSGIKIENLHKQATGHLEYVSDISLLNRLINFTPKYSLEQGLTETYNKMKEMYENSSNGRLGTSW